MKLRDMTAPALWIIAYLIVAEEIGRMTRARIPVWYRGLEKSPLTPPDFVFGIVWTILYILLALCGWRLWNRRAETRGRLRLALYTVQMLMNLAWSYFFFFYHLTGFSFIWLLGLIITVAGLMFMTKRDRTTFLLLLPYFLWISFAAYLNFTIWEFNQ